MGHQPFQAANIESNECLRPRMQKAILLGEHPIDWQGGCTLLAPVLDVASAVPSTLRKATDIRVKARRR